jgi:hypothetical protein
MPLGGTLETHAHAAIRTLDCRGSVGGRVSRITRRGTRCTCNALPNLAVFDQGGSAAPGRARVGLRPWEADPPRRAGQLAHDPMIRQAPGSITAPGVSYLPRLASVPVAAAASRAPAASHAIATRPLTRRLLTRDWRLSGRWGRSRGQLRQGRGAKLAVWKTSARARAWCPRCDLARPRARSLMPARAVRTAQVLALAEMSAGCGTPGTRAGWPGPRSPG